MARARKPASAPTPLAGRREPVATAPDQPYGVAAQQRQDQGAVPLAAPGANSPAVGTATAAAAAASTSRQVPQPGSLPWLHPTNRPEEPVTAGLPFGPGPGPDVMAQKPDLVSERLAAMARAPGATDEVAQLAAVARSMGI